MRPAIDMTSRVIRAERLPGGDCRLSIDTWSQVFPAARLDSKIQFYRRLANKGAAQARAYAPVAAALFRLKDAA